ncbi:unnamed protein product [Moneuplotes crassus]|uniref:Cullin family profile domain-containing protein n=2 Tax=Euplotes crassus TaxID=5936 RepID=A0AAD2DAM1_EUPCR|nr:unnamed protein product [Moneuplotes crassus]
MSVGIRHRQGGITLGMLRGKTKMNKNSLLSAFNLPELQKQSEALNAFKNCVKTIFTHEVLPNLEAFTQEYKNEKCIRRTLADGLDFYYDQFKIKIKNEYAIEFQRIIAEEKWFELDPANINRSTDTRILHIFKAATDYAFKVYNLHHVFLASLTKKFEFIGDQIEKLNIFFKHKMFLYSDIKFPEICLRYFTLEYYSYETFIRSAPRDVEMAIDDQLEQKFKMKSMKPPLLKATSSEYLDFDRPKKGVQINKYAHIHTVSQISDNLIDMGWSSYIEEACNRVLYSLIDKKIIKHEHETNKPILDKIHEWFQNIVVKWLERILQRESDASCRRTLSYSNLMILDQWKLKLENYLNDRFARMRYSKLFDLKNMDKYKHSLTDLKKVLAKTDILQEFSYKLKEDLCQSILIPGVPTTTIIKQYIKTIRVLRILDPSAACLEIVSEPIKEYLRRRKDTLKCIIDIVINQEDSELYKELGQQYVKIPLKTEEEEAKKPAPHLRNPHLKKETKDKNNDMNILSEEKDDYYYISSDEDEEAARNWKPAPINAKMNRYISTKFLKSDIISTLVNIYGSQKQFLTEYRNMLSERVLNSRDFNLDNERQNKELLEMRFGKASVGDLEVMIRDLQNSERRIRKYAEELNRDKENKFSNDNILDVNNMNVITISKEYWDIEEDASQFKFPYTVEDPFNSYAKKYTELHKLSELHYLSNLGNVELTLTFDNGSFKFNVSPIQAAIISLFDENENEITEEYIAEKLSIAQSDVKEHTEYWVNKGVLIEGSRYSRIAESIRKGTPGGDKSGIATFYYTPKVLKEDGA